MNLPSNISLLVFLVLAASASTSGQEDGAAVELGFDSAAERASTGSGISFRGSRP